MKSNDLKAVFVFLMLGFLQVLQSSFASSPYIEKKNQTIKALSPHAIQQLLDGDGMGFALAAELNEYPGPKHVLELRNELSLSEEQVKRSNELFERMNHQAKVYGKTIIQSERELERLFQTHIATPDSVERVVATIAQTQSKLRSLHLVTHIHQLRILTAEQNHRYQQLRGYSKGVKHSQHHGSRAHARSHQKTH